MTRAASKFTPRTETVTDGGRHLGTINVKADGCETLDADDVYVATYPNIADARRALYLRSLSPVGAVAQ